LVESRHDGLSFLGAAQAPAGRPADSEPTLGLDLDNWLGAHALRREAEALLGTRLPAGKP
jgi:hypothetical protein